MHTTQTTQNQKKKVIVIGGGLSGMTAGIYLLKYGYEVEILEKNPYLGGLCYGWTRKCSYIDGCLHWLTESRHGELHEVMKEIGLIKSAKEIINFEAYSETVVNGKSIKLYTDADKLEKELLKYAKGEDEKKIKQLTKDIKTCKRNLITAGKPYHLWNIWNKIKFIARVMKLVGVMKRYSNMSMEDYANSFESEELRFWLSNTLVIKEFFMFGFLNTIGGICDKNGGLPVGGSKQFSERLRDKFNELGGKSRTKCEVEKINLDGDHATGVRLKTGEEIESNYIVTACDLHHTLEKLLDNKFEIKKLSEYDNADEDLTYSMFLVSCRTSKNLKDVNVNRYIKTEKYDLLGHEYDCLYIKHFGYDETLCNNGQTTIQLIANTNRSQFEKLETMTREEYVQFKQELAEKMMNLLKENCGEEYGDIELIDTCTPLTFNKWVNSYKGTFMPYMMTKKHKQIILRNDLLPISNVAMAGQWSMMPGGVPIAIVQGKFAAMTIEHKDKNPNKFDKNKLIEIMSKSSEKNDGTLDRNC